MAPLGHEVSGRRWTAARQADCIPVDPVVLISVPGLVHGPQGASPRRCRLLSRANCGRGSDGSGYRQTRLPVGSRARRCRRRDTPDLARRDIPSAPAEGTASPSCRRRKSRSSRGRDAVRGKCRRGQSKDVAAPDTEPQPSVMTEFQSDEISTTLIAKLTALDARRSNVSTKAGRRPAARPATATRNCCRFWLT